MCNNQHRQFTLFLTFLLLLLIRNTTPSYHIQGQVYCFTADGVAEQPYRNAGVSLYEADWTGSWPLELVDPDDFLEDTKTAWNGTFVLRSNNSLGEEFLDGPEPFLQISHHCYSSEFDAYQMQKKNCRVSSRLDLPSTAIGQQQQHVILKLGVQTFPRQKKLSSWAECFDDATNRWVKNPDL